MVMNKFMFGIFLHRYKSIIILVFCVILTACNISTKGNNSQFVIPESWTTYSVCDNYCSISVPNTLELRNEDDYYTRHLPYGYDPSVNVFQQKGLANADLPNVDEHYCRVIISYYIGDKDDFPSPTEEFAFDKDYQAIFEELVDAETDGYFLLETPTYRWIDIGNKNKAVEINYRRTGNKRNVTNVTIDLLFNSDIMVKMVVAYRESEAELWLPDIQNIIYTFKWRK